MLMGDEEAKSMAISAAYTLAGRFNEKGKFIRAWDDWANDTPEFREEKKGKFIIDSMMNMPLLMWAGKETGDTRLIDIANQHSMTVRKYIVREDFSTYHTYNMNYTTGEPINGCTKQGYSDESCWSRGQAWAIYGFALMYSFTKNEEYLNASIKLAEYFIKKLTIFNLPYWDFEVEDLSFKPWDSSAACIAVCGMLEIEGLVKDEVLKKYFHEWSRKILDSVNHYCSTILTEDSEALLLHGCAGPVYYIENPSKVFGNSDVPLIFGDYFYVEALARVCLGDKFIRFW
jgi:unsaturated chondroitin disaccharide hydrolase